MTAVQPRAARVAASPTSRWRLAGHFLRHYFEMCAPMCLGFAVGDLVYFWTADQFGYSEPFTELPELSVAVVTFTMTAPMVAWMLFRGMPRRETTEMAAAMPVLAIVLLALGWVAIVPRGDLTLLEHGLMMPAMLVPMFVRLDFYTGRAGISRHDRGRALMVTSAAPNGIESARCRGRIRGWARRSRAPQAHVPTRRSSRSTGAGRRRRTRMFV